MRRFEAALIFPTHKLKIKYNYLKETDLTHHKRDSWVAIHLIPVLIYRRRYFTQFCKSPPLFLEAFLFAPEGAQELQGQYRNHVIRMGRSESRGANT
jgi:hypothetical protein